MGYTLDYFVGRLRCPVCGRISEADDSTNMVTAIRTEPELAYLGVGSRVEVEDADMYDSGYLTVHAPVPGSTIRILQTWECPFCGTAFNWAAIDIRDDVIVRVEAVQLTREELERANYLSTEAISVATQLTGVSTEEALKLDVVATLRNGLPSETRKGGPSEPRT